MRGQVRGLAVLACAALLAAGCASAARPGLAAGAVPWVNRPAPSFTSSPQPSPAAAYPACRAWQLTGRPGRGGPAAGTMYQEVRLTNHSGLPCTLSGGPSAVTGVRADGSLVTLTSVAHGDGWNLVGPGPANLRPGRSGWVTLAYADGCPALISGGRAGYRTLLIALGGGQVRVDFTAALNLICGLLVSDFGAPAAPPPGSASPLNVLVAIVRLPATLTAGTTASYSVTLHNTSGNRVAMSPCPSQLRRRPAVPCPRFGHVRDAHPRARRLGAGQVRLAAARHRRRHRRHGNGPRAIAAQTRAAGLGTALIGQNLELAAQAAGGVCQRRAACLRTRAAAARRSPRSGAAGAPIATARRRCRTAGLAIQPIYAPMTRGSRYEARTGNTRDRCGAAER